jgi:hypothetical protein
MLYRRRAAPSRQQRSVQVEAAFRRDIENSLRQDQAVGGDHHDIGFETAQRRGGVPGAQSSRCDRFNAEAQRGGMKGRRNQFEAAPSSRLRRAGISRRHKVTLGDDCRERRHREFRCSHKNNAQNAPAGRWDSLG